MFSGTIPAIITPFRTTGGKSEVDFDTLDKLVEWQLSCKVSGIVACGTTGESPTLSYVEQDAILSRVIKQVAGRVPVIMGTGNNSTAGSIERTRRAAELGADAGLVIVPYYNKPTQEGVYQHFKAISEASPIPLVVYNVPVRTITTIEIDTLKRIADLKQVVALKEATDNVTRIYAVCQAVAKSIDVMAGACEITATLMSVGGTGVISASANAIPEMMVAITDAALAGDLKKAHELQQVAMPYIDALFCETNPTPSKAALAIRGKLNDESLRLPLVPVSDKSRAKLEALFGELN